MIEQFAANAWAAIIASAAVSQLGIAALMLLIVGFVVLVMVITTKKASVRLLAILILMLFCGGLMAAAIYSARPSVLPPVATAGAQIEKNLPQPPAPESQPPTSPPPGPPAAPASSRPATKASTAKTERVRTDCGTEWTGWIDIGGSVGNPCPSGCTRGAELGQSPRAVGFPPRLQVKHKFQCWHE